MVEIAPDPENVAHTEVLMRPALRHAALPTHVLALAGLAGMLSWGCASGGGGGDGGPRQAVTASDFSDGTVTRERAAPASPPIVSREDAGAGLGSGRASGGEVAARTTIARPVVARAPGEEQRFLVDEMVGQVNGKPIYADEFFQDMDARLRAEAQRLPLGEWVKMVTDNVAGKLRTETQDELLLSEFQSSLTPEQRIGVLAFVEDLRKNIQRDYGGSTELANQRLQEEEGVTLREKVEREAERQFIIAQLRETIAKRVQVSSKDIERYYYQHIDEYQPAPEAVFRVIRVPLSSAGRIDSVETCLARGQSPAEVAREYSDWAPEEGNVHTVTLESRDLSLATIWGPEPLNEASKRLEPGQVTERIDFASRAWWVYLEEIKSPPGKSLYDVQLEIEQVVRGERIKEQEGRYWESLLQRSNMTEFDEMVRRLVAYAAERYYVRKIYEEGEVSVGGSGGDASDATEGDGEG